MLDWNTNKSYSTTTQRSGMEDPVIRKNTMFVLTLIVSDHLKFGKYTFLAPAKVHFEDLSKDIFLEPKMNYPGVTITRSFLFLRLGTFA